MASSSRFSLSAMILGYLLVAGGIAIGILLVAQVGIKSEAAAYLALAIGGAIGGAIAATASEGKTVIEPAIGGGLVVLTLVGVFAGTNAGAILWHVAKDELIRQVAIAGGAAAVGALVGAVAAEKLSARHPDGSLAWIVIIAVAALGACMVSLFVLAGAMARGAEGDSELAGTFFAAMGLGSLLTGLAAGAAAPRRVLLPTLVGVLAGVMGFYLLIAALPGVDNDKRGEAAAGFAIIGVGCGLVAMLGTAVGWALVGKRRAARSDDAVRALA